MGVAPSADVKARCTGLLQQTGGVTHDVTHEGVIRDLTAASGQRARDGMHRQRPHEG